MAMEYLGKAHGIQTKEQRHRILSNLVLKGKVCEAVRFVYAWEMWEYCKPGQLVEDRTCTTNKTFALLMEGKNLHKELLPLPH